MITDTELQNSPICCSAEQIAEQKWVDKRRLNKDIFFPLYFISRRSSLTWIIYWHRVQLPCQNLASLFVCNLVLIPPPFKSMNLAWIIKQKGVIHTTDLNHLIMCAHRVMLKSCSTLYLVLNGQVLHSFCIMDANDHSVALFLHNANYNNGQPAGDYRVFLQFFPHTNKRFI